MRPRGAGPVDGDEVRQGRPVGGVGAEADEVEVGGGDARDGEDGGPGQGFRAREAGEDRGRERRGGMEGVQRRRQRGRFAVSSSVARFELDIGVEAVVVVFGERRARSFFSRSSAAEPAAAEQDAASTAACACAAAEQLAGAAVPGAGCFNLFLNFEGKERRGREKRESEFFFQFPFFPFLFPPSLPPSLPSSLSLSKHSRQRGQKKKEDEELPSPQRYSR